MEDAFDKFDKWMAENLPPEVEVYKERNMSRVKEGRYSPEEDQAILSKLAVIGYKWGGRQFWRVDFPSDATWELAEELGRRRDSIKGRIRTLQAKELRRSLSIETQRQRLETGISDLDLNQIRALKRLWRKMAACAQVEFVRAHIGAEILAAAAKPRSGAAETYGHVEAEKIPLAQISSKR